MIQPGDTIGGRYRVGRTLGKGGMGEVVEATHLQLGTPVAIKILRADKMDAESRERFQREARAAAQLRGEHVCRAHDFGTLDDGSPYMVMELLTGNDLADLLETGPLDPKIAATYVLQACMALAEAHGRGIIHRDLKPRNLFVVERPDGATTLKVLDFGIAKSQAKSNVDLTETMNVVGSPAYMSPEQLKSSKHVDPRSDIWSLGVVLYQLLSQEQPFIGESLTELALAIASEAPPPLPDNVPPELVAVVLKCLEKDPADRYQDVAALAAALETFLGSFGTSAKPISKSLAQVLTSLSAPQFDGDATANVRPPSNTKKDPATTLHSASGMVNAIPAPRSRWRFAVTLVLVTIIASVATAFVVITMSNDEEVAPAASPSPVVVVPDAAPMVEMDAAPVVEVDAAVVEPDAATEPASSPPAVKKKKKKKKSWKDSRY